MKKFTANSSSGAIIICILLAAIFISEQLLLPVSAADTGYFGTSMSAYRLISIMVNLPLVMVWFVAFWGYSRLKAFVEQLGDAPEANGYQKLSTGLTWLAWSLPLLAIINRFLAGLDTHNLNSRHTMTIISNYFNLLMPLVAFIIIFVATKSLVKSHKLLKGEARSSLLMSVFLLFGAIYCYLVLKTADLSSFSSSNNIYGIPVWLMIITLIIPYLYGWFLGLLAVYDLSLLSRSVPGMLYKQALWYLTSGLSAVILSFIAIQYLAALWPLKAHIVVDYRLIIIILFRIIGGLGFIFLAVGANKLKRIEEV